MKTRELTYRVTWSVEDREHAGLCAAFPSLSWLAQTPEEAPAGICRLAKGALAYLESARETAPADSAKLSS